MPNVKMSSTRKIGLLKNEAKTLYSFYPSFLEFIWLKICIKTKVWKKIEYICAFYVGSCNFQPRSVARSAMLSISSLEG